MKFNDQGHSLYYGSKYQGVRVYTKKGALVENYLVKTFHTIKQAIKSNPRTFAIRFDLHFFPEIESSESFIITKFFESLKAQIKANRTKASRNNVRTHLSDVRYVWCREREKSKNAHYHVLLLFNADAFDSLGKVNAHEGNMAGRIKKAWASALGCLVEDIDTLVHFCEKGTYKIMPSNYETQLPLLLYRASYLCKAITKDFGDYRHAFGCSRH
ncbi:inovirus Gp2 family protein [Marinomonas sp. BSi20584]|uniref:inovirus Gp2 family protein n=1 Tax=Marinomonas sp. BSi20584 TaxID=1594462 RepID=UPI000C1EA1FD|nr:inovirus Gp2 family protein [Marinomonas sp. BSi20584]PJE53689.1 hypothetical protein TY87_19240 [Marinomonas sp. BSi20584]